MVRAGASGTAGARSSATGAMATALAGAGSLLYFPDWTSSAAAIITAVTALGSASIATWLVGTLMTFAPIRAAIAAWNLGSIIWSFSPITHHDGLSCQA